MTDDLLTTAEDWAALDPDPATAAELRALIDRARAGDTAAADEIADANARADEDGRPPMAIGERVEVEIPAPKGLADRNRSKDDKSE